MSNIQNTILFTVLVMVLSFIPYTRSATFNIVNNCAYTVWAAASPGGGSQLSQGATWTINVPQGTTGGRIWARTGCTPSGANGLNCQTGDCGGVLQCTGYGKNPNTLAEYGLNKYNNLDFFDISLVAGFNVPMAFVGVSNGCSSGPVCSANVNSQCPSALQTQGGCNDPCTVFNKPEYCCPPGSGACNPTQYSQYFKGQCPTAFSYPYDYQGTAFTCPTGTNYKVTFCP